MKSHEKNVMNNSTTENLEISKGKGTSSSPLLRFVSGSSRYGRTIKPKSYTNVTFDSPKNTKMPKNAKHETTTEDENIKMEDTSIMEDSINSSFDISLEDNNKVETEDAQSKCPWTLGQLVWARIGSFPFWPGVVTLDPETMKFVAKRGQYRKNQVHVWYCADKGRHSWVSFNNVIPFNGLAEFEKRAKDLTPDLKKKEPKYAAALIIKPTIKLKWDDAVSEATRLMNKSIEVRIELFKPKNKKINYSEKLLNSTNEKSDENKKRKALMEEPIMLKKSKQNFEEGEDPDYEIENKISLEKNVNIDAPPTPPSSHKDSSDEAPIAKRFKLKKRCGKEGVFEIFCERNKEAAEQLDPDATEADIKAYLEDLWDSMSIQERSKYRADYLQEEDMVLYSLGVDEDDVDSEPEPEKPSRRRRTKTEAEFDELCDRRKSKTLNKTNDELSDQEETTSVESDEIVEKPIRRRRTKGRRDSSDRDDVPNNEINGKSAKKRKSKVEKDEEDLESEPEPLPFDYSKRPRYKLFKGLKNEKVCQICETPGKLIRCKGPCYSHFHLNCVKPGESSPEPSEAGDIEENEAYKEDLKEIKEKMKQKEEELFDEENFKCIDCLSGVAPACFVCHERDGERTKCSVLACGKHYHMSCLKGWPQCQWQGDRLNCPYHVCHTCVSDNPQNGHPRSNNEKFIRCVRCPSSYHASVDCLPAGSNLLTASQTVCPKHYKSNHPPVNATWCFLCTEGGSLICCDTCPTSFHLECLGIDAPDGGFICEDCETGRLPLYGEVVWVKLGNYRWWPSVICYPQEIPPNIAAKPHKTGQFCVMFFGTRDYYWIHRGKAFLFQEGDASTKVIGSKKVEESYRRALKEAKYFHERVLHERAVKDKENETKDLKPPHYVKLKVNKPVGNVKIPEVDSMAACDCDPNSPNPCSPDSDCLNRILLIECSPDACPAGTKCHNQMFVQRKYPSMKPFHTEERGWGLKTLEAIPQGRFIIEYVGEIIDEAEYRLRIQQKKERKNENYYFLTIDNSRMIDAEPKGNLSRFMNHSCQPNCETQKWTVNGDTRIGLFALRDIEPDEELTFNYNLACDGETKKPCLCKAPNCSGFIGLKVPKNSLNMAQQKKIEKARRGRKRLKALMCWNCNEKIENLNDAYRCDQKTCGKAYHPHCIAIEDGPDQIFHCPWHFCAECYKRTSIRCSYCCNAFCQEHIHGNLREQSNGRILICYNHPTVYTDYEEMDMDMGEALMDDDGEEDDLNMSEEQCFTDDSLVKVSHNIVSSSPRQKPVSDEASPRGAIVEVQASSEEGEEDESQEDDDGNITATKKGKKGRGRRKKEETTESDFTLDQIAAIIGIVK